MANGTVVTITVHGAPVANVIPYQMLSRRRLTISRSTWETKPSLLATAVSAGLFDASVFVAIEAGRPIDEGLFSGDVFVSVVTSAELTVGVLAAKDTETRAQRLATLSLTAGLDLLPVDRKAAA